jgi:hypothetical protein
MAKGWRTDLIDTLIQRRFDRNRAQECTLDSTEKGMLPKYDFFKVVSNPGSDKRGQWVPGQASPTICRGDTGGVMRLA